MYDCYVYIMHTILIIIIINQKIDLSNAYYFMEEYTCM